MAIANTPSLNASIRAGSLIAVARWGAIRQQQAEGVRWCPRRRRMADRRQIEIEGRAGAAELARDSACGPFADSSDRVSFRRHPIGEVWFIANRRRLRIRPASRSKQTTEYSRRGAGYATYQSPLYLH